MRAVHERQTAVPGVDGRAGRPRDLGVRLGSAVVMAAVAIAAAVLGGWAFDLFWLAAGLAILWEWLGLVGVPRRPAVVLPGALALAVAAAFANRELPLGSVAALAVGAIVTALLCDPRQRGVAAGGPLYAGALVTAVLVLRHSAVDGVAALVWLFAVVWGTDTFAYFGGRLIGGPKLAPRLSPSKTWSGFVCGVVSGAILGWLVAPHGDHPGSVVLAGLAGGALAQAGDLFESALKRRFGVKDAGSLIPGHGGVMDRLDGFIAASVFAAVVGVWRFGPMGSGAGLLRW